MGGMNTSDSRQNTKHKNHFEACKNKGTWETHKAKRAKRTATKIAKHAAKIESRLIAGEPARGTARKFRRAVV